MKKLIVIAVLILGCQAIIFAQSKPQVIKESVMLRADRDQMYWKQPNTENIWNWIAVASFGMTGEIPDASFVNVEFTMPDGKKWYDVDITAPPTAAGGYAQINAGGSSMHGDKRGILDTGVFGIKITLKNGLSNTSQELYKGRFTVKKFHVGNNLPAFKNQFEYYVDEDWRLPIGFLQLNQATAADNRRLDAAMWFRGENVNNISAYLFQNGKQIGSTKDGGGGSQNSPLKLLTSGNDTEPRWEQWLFSFYGNPLTAGNYEIKVLYDGELSRTMSFTVGANGAIPDNGIAAKNNFVWKFQVVPIKIVDAKTAPAFPYNANGWKNDALYGNPLVGFTAQ